MKHQVTLKSLRILVAITTATCDALPTIKPSLSLSLSLALALSLFLFLSLVLSLPLSMCMNVFLCLSPALFACQSLSLVSVCPFLERQYCPEDASVFLF